MPKVEDLTEPDAVVIDTAHGYGDSEEKIGIALQGERRKDVILAIKAPAPDAKTAQ